MSGEKVVNAADPSLNPSLNGDGGLDGTNVAPRRIDLLDGVEAGDVLDVSQSLSGVEERDGLIWKELLYTGKWPGNDAIPALIITRGMLEDILESFQAGALRHVDVPVGNHGLDAVETNSGFVQALEIRNAISEESTLWVGIRFTDTEIEQKVREGSIANVSARLQKNFTDPLTGRTWALVLWHVALTNKPVLKGLRPFVVVSLVGLNVRAYKKEEFAGMSNEKVNEQAKGVHVVSEEKEIVASGLQEQEPVTLSQAKGVDDVSDAQVTEVVTLSQEQSDKVREDELESIRQEIEQEHEKTLAGVMERLKTAEALALAHQIQLHKVEVDRKILALQGRGEHELVKLPSGYAFAPSVVKYVQPFLEADIGGDEIVLSIAGKEIKQTLTNLLLGCLNAVAQAKDGAVISLAVHGTQTHTPPGTGLVTESEKDSQIDEYMKERGLVPAEESS